MSAIRFVIATILIAGSAPALAADAPKADAKPAATTAPKETKAEAALKAADRDWSKNATNVDADVAVYSDDAEMFVPNAPLASGKEEIKKMWTGMTGMPGFAISWEPNRVAVSKGGDLGYVSGTYSFTANGPDGKPATDHGKYLEVWKKVGDKWKCAADIFNSSTPAPAKQGG